MAAGFYPIEIEQGATYDLGVTLRQRDDNGVILDPTTGLRYSLWDITDWTPMAHIRRNYKDPEPTLTFICIKTIAYPTATDEENGTNGVTARVLMTINPDDSSALPEIYPEYVWSLEMHNNLDTTRKIRVLAGPCSISPEATWVGA